MRSGARAMGLIAGTLALAFAALAEPPAKLTPSPRHPQADGVTRCDLCHSTAGWDQARFAHERTGFPLEGAHQQARCRSCHRKSLSQKLGQLCSGCHRDPHRGQLGQRCDGCHDANGWRSRFSADAHRRTAFPLEGRHALIPCAECHGEARERSFARPAYGCQSCHADDYARTSAGASLDHVALRLPETCEDCHSAFRFTPAKFPQHDVCFELSAGDHANLRCGSCHGSIPASTHFGSCDSGSARCTTCHEHSCRRTDEKHREVLGYQCTDRKCYECHRLGGRR